MLLEIIKSIFLGIVQGITEWLPVSSTGHMILFDRLFTLNVPESFKNLFFVVIQLGSIIAVIFLYFNRLNPFNPRLSMQKKTSIYRLWLMIIIASIPAAFAMLADDTIDALFYNPPCIAVALIVYGVLFIWMENRSREPRITSESQINYKIALILGVFQLLAVIPGTSRSGAIILGATLIGFARPLAAEFTFYMAIPAMVGASGFKILKFIISDSAKDVVTDGMITSGFGQFIILLFGFVTAFAVSFFVIRFLLNYIRKHDFKIFGYYRIGLGILIILVELIGAIER